MNLNRRIPLRDSERAPVHNGDSAGIGCAKLIVSILTATCAGITILAFVIRKIQE